MVISHIPHFFWWFYLHYLYIIMELNITLEGSSRVQESFRKNMDLKIAQNHWKMMTHLAPQILTWNLTYEADRLFLF